jgi:hypothetical protein
VVATGCSRRGRWPSSSASARRPCIGFARAASCRASESSNRSECDRPTSLHFSRDGSRDRPILSHHGTRATAQLRDVRQGPASVVDGSMHLLVRMHLLRSVRSRRTTQRLPQLRRRVHRTTDPAREGMAPGALRRKAAAVDEAGASLVQPRGDRRAFTAARSSCSGVALAPTEQTLLGPRASSRAAERPGSRASSG